MTMLNDAAYIRGLVSSTREDFYPTFSGYPSESRSLAHWAMRNILAAEDISHDRLMELTRIGGPNDCGIDGWYIDDNDDLPFLYLFQAKAGGDDCRVEENELSELSDATSRLLDPNRAKNVEAAQLAHDLQQWLSQGILISMHFVTTCQIGPATQTAVARLAQQQVLSFTIDGGSLSVPCDFHLWSPTDLRAVHADLLRLGTVPPTVDELTLAGSNSAGKFTEAVASSDTGPVNTAYFLAYARELANIFNGPPKRWSLFRENPRGALQRKNPSIWRTLQSQEQRGRFHALNNGLSIVCDDYTISPEHSTIAVENMRIVNGCQTTVTLGEALAQTKGASLLDDTVLVPVRVTKTSEVDFRENVAHATNTQRQVTPADMASLKDEMRKYHELFDLMAPKYFFEIQAGNWDYMMNKDEKARYAARIEREPLAQAVMAFKGKPGEALEDRRYIFARPTTTDGKGWYDDIFASHIPPEQMLLAWKTLVQVQGSLKLADQDQKNTMNFPEYTRYSTLVRTWLTSEIIGRHFNTDFSVESLPATVSKSLAENENWFATVYEAVNEAVFSAIRELRNAYPDVEDRNFFRQAHRQLPATGSAPGKVPMNIFRELLAVPTGRSADRDRIANALSAASTP